MMHPYRVKENLWLAIAILFALIALVGCSSTPKGPAKQYCYTSQEIRTKDRQTVSSETVVKCNDDPVEQIVIKKAGIAQNCGETTDWITLPNGKEIKVRNLVCQKFDGRWEIIPEYAGR
jgi:uncharacterized protein YcfL